jgi:hypothetical protein
MIENLGIVDRLLRVLLALTILVLYLTGSITGVGAVVLGALAFVFVFTGIMGWCPLYMPFRFSTRRRHEPYTT